MCAAGDPLNAETIAGLPASVRIIIATFSVGYEHVDVAAGGQARHPGLQHARRADRRHGDIALLCLLGAARRASRRHDHAQDPQLGRLDADPAHGGARHRQATRYPGHGPHRPGGGRPGARLPHADPLLQPLALAADLEKGATFHANPDDMLPHCDFLSINAPMTRRNDANGSHSRAPSPSCPRAHRGETGARRRGRRRGVIAALKSGRLAAAGIDVFDGEPKIHHGYYGLTNAFLLPHMGSATVETRKRHGLQGARQPRSLPAQEAGAAGRREGFLTE
jgi:lactate dehydrogenase-like 2-hydroxyacid dehydrogenase